MAVLVALTTISPIASAFPPFRTFAVTAVVLMRLGLGSLAGLLRAAVA